MDNRLTYGLGTAAVALLLLPLGYQLYTSTAITPVGVPPVTATDGRAGAVRLSSTARASGGGNGTTAGAMAWRRERRGAGQRQCRDGNADG